MRYKQRNQKLDMTSYGTHLPFEKVIAFACILTFLLSPVAPLFASEDTSQEGGSTTASEETPAREENVNSEEVEQVEMTESQKEETRDANHDEIVSERADNALEESDFKEEGDEDVQTAPSQSTEEFTNGFTKLGEGEELTMQSQDDSAEGDAMPSVTNEMNEESSHNPEGAPESTPIVETQGMVSTSTISEDELSIGATTSTQMPNDVIVEPEQVPIAPAEEEKEVLQEEVATGTPENTEAIVPVVQTTGNEIAFLKDECVSVSEGTYYCTKIKTERVPLHVDRIFAASDEDGDKEIYVEKDSIVTQITFNELDDDAPYFDESANRIVWHRLIDGRYQIMMYDVASNKETQVTFDRYNNMNPNSFGDAVVWQGWVGNDWEIFMLVGNELKMITDNTTHDIAASINGTHVVWQSFEGDVWRMKLYDIRTGSIETIGDADGSIQNPRFVLVYDTTLESGDIETRGYDLKSGEVVPLSATPKPVPTEIPDPEQTGEERALVAPNTQPKSKTEDVDDDQNAVGGPGPDPVQNATGTLVIPPLVTDSDVAASSTVDLVLSTSTSRTVEHDVYEHIQDLVIVPSIVDDLLPQDTVAEVE